MIYAYLRVSTDKQTVENQRYEILKYADTKKLSIDQWIEKTASGVKSVKDRKVRGLLTRMEKGDIFLVSELSQLGRNLMEIMFILHECMEKT